MSDSLRILGCGASAGVPLIGCGCAVCQSDDRRNKRSRASVLFRFKGRHILVDTSPDLRQQALAAGLTRVDAIIYTHAHADHCHGIDDVRSFNFHANAAIPAWGMAQTLEELQQRFAYVFQPPPDYGWYRAALQPQTIYSDGRTTEILEGIEVKSFIQDHGRVKSLGIRIGNAAYCTDVNAFPEGSKPHLCGLDVLVIDCLRPEATPAHASLAQSLQWIEEFAPKRAVLTHLSHAFDYAALQDSLPPHISVAYDGMEIAL